MEYRRRKRRRRLSQSKATSAKSTAKVVVVLLVIAGLIYVVSASTVGTWISKNVFAPMFETVDGWFTVDKPTPTPEAGGLVIEPPLAANDDNDASTSTAAVTDDVEFPALECFALQMGVYNEKSNAENQAGELKARGAGGYVMEDIGRYRVLAAAYSTQESLAAVREQLKAEGLESAAYIFETTGNTLRITASKEQLDGIASGFSSLTRLCADMAEASLNYDKLQQTPAQGRESAAAMLTALRNSKDAFSIYASDDNPVLKATMSCFTACEDALSSLAGDPSESMVDFSSKLKYTHISILHEYDKLSKAIQSIA